MLIIFVAELLPYFLCHVNDYTVLSIEIRENT